MSNSDRFQRPKDTLSWAREAILELETAFADFFKPKPLGPIVNGRKVYGEVVDIDPETGNEIHKLKIFEALPSILSRKSTEALINTRHSFDQIVYAAVTGSGITPENNVLFPWRSSPTDLKATLEKGEIPEVFWDTLKREEPYPTSNSHPGGDDIVRELAKLANGKHTVGLTAFAQVVSFTHPTISGTSNVVIIPQIRWDPVKNEMPLAIVSPGTNVHHDYNVSLQVALDVPPPLRDIPAIELLKSFADKADRFLEAIERDLKGLKE